MHRGAAQIPYLAQIYCAGHLLWHTSSSSSPVCCAWHSSHWGPDVPPRAINQQHFSSPSKPPPFLFVLRWKLCNMQPILQILNYTIICLQAQVMTGVQEPDHTKRNKLMKIHPDSSSHPYAGPIAVSSIPKDIWINHWQQTRGRKIQANTHHAVITWQCANTPTCLKRRAHGALFSKHKGI